MSIKKPLEPKDRTKTILFLKWERWFENHPKSPYKNLEDCIPLIDIAFLLGYAPPTIKSYLYAYGNKDKINNKKGYREQYIKHTINPNATGDMRFVVILKDVIDFIVEMDYKDRFYDTTPHPKEDDEEQ